MKKQLLILFMLGLVLSACTPYYEWTCNVFGVNCELVEEGETATAEDAEAEADAPEEEQTAEDLGLPPVNKECPTTAWAKEQLELDVQRYDAEPCSWVWRAVPEASTNVMCKDGWLCTIHHPNDDIRVYVGEGNEYQLVAGTFRYRPAFPASDAVNEPCELLAKEQAFGDREDPSFDVLPGNFTCTGADVDLDNDEMVADYSCPEFGGEELEPIGDGACKLDWVPSRGTVSGRVPEGYVADTDTEGRVPSGRMVTVGSMTLWPED